jgi:hypothetical protein
LDPDTTVAIAVTVYVPPPMRVVAIVAVLASASPAHAGNEDSFLFGGHALMTGGAVVASSRDTAAIWYNPAGLGDNDRGRVELSATAFTLRIRPIGNGLALDVPTATIETPIESREVYVVPAALGVAKNLKSGISIAAGLFATEQDLFNYKRSVNSGDDTVALDVAGALTGTLIRYHAGGAIGVRASRHVRVGAAVFGVYEDYREFRKLFARATMTGVYEEAFLQRLVDARATRYGVEALAGIQVDVGRWQLGLTARSPRLVLREKADTDNSTVLVASGPTATPVTFSEVDHQPLGTEGKGFTHSARFTLGAARRLRTLEISGELDLRTPYVGTPPAMIQDRTRLDQSAVWNARAGVLWDATKRHRFGIGAFTDRTGAAAPAAFPDARVDYYGISGGWRRLNTVRLRPGQHAPTLRFSTTVAVRYALGTGESTRIRFDFRDTPTTGMVGRADAELVDVTYHELSLYVGSGFEF